MPDPKPSRDDPFYVGYLPIPPRHLRFVRRLVWLLLIWIIALGVLIAARMRPAGDAVWHTAVERTWTGTIALDPYPMLIPDDGSGPLLIVEMGKHGAHPRVAPLDNHAAEVRGYLLERDGRRIIELTPDETALASFGRAPAIPSDQASPGISATLTGEIVDGKCYLGAMKPGDGITHKSCATLCVRGGLPPMLVCIENGRPVFRLLLVDGSTTLAEPVLGLIAEPVRVEGELAEINGLPVIRTTAAHITAY